MTPLVAGRPPIRRTLLFLLQEQDGAREPGVRRDEVYVLHTSRIRCPIVLTPVPVLHVLARLADAPRQGPDPASVDREERELHRTVRSEADVGGAGNQSAEAGPPRSDYLAR